MSGTQVISRGDTTTNLIAYGALALAEIGVDTTVGAIVLGDGSTAGGRRVTPTQNTWTPELLGSGGNPTVTSSVSEGWFVQMGPLVIGQGALTLTGIAGGSGSAEIGDASGNLPTLVTTAHSNGQGIISMLGNYVHASSNYTQVGLNMGGTLGPSVGVLFFLEEYGSSQAVSQGAISQITPSFTVSFGFCYLTPWPAG